MPEPEINRSPLDIAEPYYTRVLWTRRAMFALGGSLAVPYTLAMYLCAAHPFARVANGPIIAGILTLLGAAIIFSGLKDVEHRQLNAAWRRESVNEALELPVVTEWESERLEPIPVPVVTPAPIVNNFYLAPGWMQQLPQTAPVFNGRVIDPAEFLALPEAHGTAS